MKNKNNKSKIILDSKQIIIFRNHIKKIRLYIINNLKKNIKKN